MASTYRILLNGSVASDDFYSRISALEVEENADMPGAVQMTMAIARSEDGDLTSVNDAGLQPFANVAVVSAAEGKTDECIFDGYILSQKIHLESGITASTVEAWGQDASCLMRLEETSREWADVTDGAVANTIAGKYGFTPAPENTADDSPAHTSDGHSLMQRASDFDFLRMLARRTGKLFRVACASAPGAYTAFFATPSVEGEAVVTLKPNDPEGANVGPLDVEWDVMRPSEIQTRQATFTDTTEASGDVTESGLAPLDERNLAAFAARPVKAMLTTPADDAVELRMRAAAVLRESGWFVRCTGESDVSRLQHVLRVGQVVAIDGAGSVHSGKYFVWSVRHMLTADAHKMRFVLMRNAVGPAAAGGGGLLGGLL